ncbi:chemoreceptor glutamine deamidase CheD [Shewanella maritima]|uniref:chemoreceptor glutamine deamidase CheD n=1 Tax=Shewanella maritima TaxID=2520507 RepID=UPI003735BE46
MNNAPHSQQLVASTRKFNREQNAMMVRVDPGQFYVSGQDELIFTRLGSCVAACIWDPVTGVGGINHFLLPGNEQQNEWQQVTSYSCRYGNWAMEQLINGILTSGGLRSRLQAKVFGGARMSAHIQQNIGLDNIEFVKHYLALEGINIVSEDLGGEQPRKLMFHPQTGRVLLKWLPANIIEQLQQQETQYISHLKDDDADTSDIELF